MKRVLPVLIALFVASTASAQAPGGSAAAPNPNNAPMAVPAADPAAGSAALGGSAASGTGSAGTGSGSAAAAPSGPQISVVPCPTHVRQVVGPDLAQHPAVTDVARFEVALNEPVEFTLGASDMHNDLPAGVGLDVPANSTTCLVFKSAGTFTVHSSSGKHGTIIAKSWYDVLSDLKIEEGGTFWLPKSVNSAADASDMMFYAVLALSGFFFFAIAIAVVYLTVKYRHRPGHTAEPSVAHNDVLEITWTVIPTIICVFLFWYGWHSYINIVTPPQKAVEIDVLAWRWNWQFTHENGVTDSDLHVPADVPVRLVMTSKDVLHSFYLPSMRIKQDLVPRRYTYAWFNATKPGTYRLTCAEYCGTSHAQMACLETDPITGHCNRRAVVVVHKDLEEYERYLNDKVQDQMSMAPEDLGRLLYDKKGCASCHTIDGSVRVGPSWKQPDWGKDIAIVGGTVKMDENYVRESILYPAKKARPGYPNSMPSFEGQLKDKELTGLIAYIKSLKQ
jgi:cytochrome c oxidase subunit 2